MEPQLIAFWAKKVLALLILPPAGPLLLIGLGLLRTRLRALAWAGWLYALAVSMPISVNWLAARLETAPPISDAALAQTQAIVVLGAGVRDYAPEFGHPTVNRLALERLRYGARLARETGRPLLLAGGAPAGRIPEALMMYEAMETDFGIAVRWIEATSLDTRDNANHSAQILRAEGIEHIALVTHAAHMPRAQAAFEAAGLRVTPAPTAWLSNPDPEIQFADFIPNAKSTYAGWFAVHEWVGALAYRFTAPPPPAPAPR
ncbi:YdcF family protein [Denitromonas iodatirespirans]|uniref:YdcF family protein n=1 Tax=Denitromonas iodatirespirans TaxID=2795389 RepID=A0A944DA56_DENI1|nr:YdcF family protein [Denitromonas iodatirespirans]MBT0962789.1 YdcF family protein [Denitromonas iodatirespirans]